MWIVGAAVGSFCFADLLELRHETGQEWLAIVGVEYLHTL
jgi:hypothetical protein